MFFIAFYECSYSYPLLSIINIASKGLTVCNRWQTLGNYFDFSAKLTEYMQLYNDSI